MRRKILSKVESNNLLKVDAVARKARSTTSDLVTELKGPVLGFHCNVCPVCVDSLDQKRMPTLTLTNGLWIGDIPTELQDLTSLSSWSHFFTNHTSRFFKHICRSISTK